MKKTKEEAIDWMYSFINPIQLKLGLPYTINLYEWTIWNFWHNVINFPINGTELEISFAIRIKGDDNSFMWEPDDGSDRSKGWKGDYIKMMYGSGAKHDCPYCECWKEHYQSKKFNDSIEALEWVDSLLTLNRSV
jgi:hypothetical protein